MRPTHGDYRPGARRRNVSRNVPRGGTRRKFPLIRIILALALGFFIYSRFDDYWPRVREALDFTPPWAGDRAQDEPPADATAQRWAADSSRLALECRQGLSGTCCEALEAASRGLCGETEALLARARWMGAVTEGGTGTPDAPLRVEAQRNADDGEGRLALSGLTGRDAKGVFRFRRSGSGTAGAGAWCEASRGCLRGFGASPAAPLSQGRLEASASSATLGEAVWTSASPWVRAALPGHIVSVDSTAAGSIVRVYHGFELYVAYGPLRAAPGVRPGAVVKAGSHLGDALPRGSTRALPVRVRKAGRDLDPAAFWGVRAAPAANPGYGSGEDVLYSRLDP